jgi:hypothetical protein
MILGCDLSHYQPVQPVPEAVQFAWLKSSEGTSSRDGHYAGHRRSFKTAGKPSGPYHFLRPVGDPRAQARAWRSAAGPVAAGDLRPAADIEVPGFSVKWLLAFLDEATKAFGVAPVIYASLGYLPQLRGLESFDLWIAAYRKTMPKPAGWRVVAWQNTDRGPMGGDGNLAPSLAPLLVGGHPVVTPPTLPEAHVILNKPACRIVLHESAGHCDGYWIVAEDGGVFAFGAAPQVGNAVDIPLAAPICDAEKTPSQNGLILLGEDGGVFPLGDAPFLGSVPGL